MNRTADDDTRVRMTRRTALACLAGGVGGLAGCTCQGDTRPGLEFDTTLESIGYDDEAEVWRAACSVLVRFDYVSEDRSDVGFTGASLVAFARDGTRLARHRLGNVTWRDVPRSNRRTFDAQCGGRYQLGRLTRRGRLRANRFPYRFGLLWDERTGRNPVSDGDGVVTYAGDAVPDRTPNTSEYEQLTVDGSEWPPETTPTTEP